jgi:hypothetical protein
LPGLPGDEQLRNGVDVRTEEMDQLDREITQARSGPPSHPAENI